MDEQQRRQLQERYSTYNKRLCEITGTTETLGQVVRKLNEVPLREDPRRKAPQQKADDIDFSNNQHPLRVLCENPDPDGKDYKNLLRRIVVPPQLIAPYSYPPPSHIPATRDPRRLRSSLRLGYDKDEVVSSLVEFEVPVTPNFWPVLTQDLTDWPNSKHSYIEDSSQQGIMQKTENDPFLEDCKYDVSDGSIEVIEIKPKKKCEFDESGDQCVESMLESDDDCIIEVNGTYLGSDRWCKIYDDDDDLNKPIIKVKEEPSEFRPLPRADSENVEFVDLCADEYDIKIENNLDDNKTGIDIEENLHPKFNRAKNSKFLQESVRECLEVVTLDDDDDEKNDFQINNDWPIEVFTGVSVNNNISTNSEQPESDLFPSITESRNTQPTIPTASPSIRVCDFALERPVSRNSRRRKKKKRKHDKEQPAALCSSTTSRLDDITDETQRRKTFEQVYNNVARELESVELLAPTSPEEQQQQQHEPTGRGMSFDTQSQRISDPSVVKRVESSSASTTASWPDTAETVINKPSNAISEFTEKVRTIEKRDANHQSRSYNVDSYIYEVTSYDDYKKNREKKDSISDSNIQQHIARLEAVKTRDAFYVEKEKPKEKDNNRLQPVIRDYFRYDSDDDDDDDADEESRQLQGDPSEEARKNETRAAAAGDALDKDHIRVENPFCSTAEKLHTNASKDSELHTDASKDLSTNGFRTCSEIRESFLRAATDSSDEEEPQQQEQQQLGNDNTTVALYGPRQVNNNGEIDRPAVQWQYDTSWLARIYDEVFANQIPTQENAVVIEEEKDFTEDSYVENLCGTEKQNFNGSSSQSHVDYSANVSNKDSQLENHLEVNNVETTTSVVSLSRCNLPRTTESTIARPMLAIEEGRKRKITESDKDSRIEFVTPAKRHKSRWDDHLNREEEEHCITFYTNYKSSPGGQIDFRELLSRFVLYAKHYALSTIGLNFFLKDRPALSIIAYIRLHEQVVRNQSFWRDRYDHLCQEKKCAVKYNSSNAGHHNGNKLSISEKNEEIHHSSCLECTKNKNKNFENETKYTPELSFTLKLDVNSNTNQPIDNLKTVKKSVFYEEVSEKSKNIKKRRTKSEEIKIPRGADYIKDFIPNQKNNSRYNWDALKARESAEYIKKELTDDGLSIQKSKFTETQVNPSLHQIEFRNSFQFVDKDVPELGDVDNKPVVKRDFNLEDNINPQLKSIVKKKSRSLDLEEDSGHPSKKQKLSTDFISQKSMPDTRNNNSSIESSVSNGNVNIQQTYEIGIQNLPNAIGDDGESPNEMFYKGKHHNSSSDSEESFEKEAAILNQENISNDNNYSYAPSSGNKTFSNDMNSDSDLSDVNSESLVKKNVSKKPMKKRKSSKEILLFGEDSDDERVEGSNKDQQIKKTDGSSMEQNTENNNTILKEPVESSSASLNEDKLEGENQVQVAEEEHNAQNEVKDQVQGTSEKNQSLDSKEISNQVELLQPADQDLLYNLNDNNKNQEKPVNNDYFNEKNIFQSLVQKEQNLENTILEKSVESPSTSLNEDKLEIENQVQVAEEQLNAQNEVDDQIQETSEKNQSLDSKEISNRIELLEPADQDLLSNLNEKISNKNQEKAVNNDHFNEKNVENSLSNDCCVPEIDGIEGDLDFAGMLDYEPEDNYNYNSDSDYDETNDLPLESEKFINIEKYCNPETPEESDKNENNFQEGKNEISEESDDDVLFLEEVPSTKKLSEANNKEVKVEVGGEIVTLSNGKETVEIQGNQYSENDELLQEILEALDAVDPPVSTSNNNNKEFMSKDFESTDSNKTDNVSFQSTDAVNLAVSTSISNRESQDCVSPDMNNIDNNPNLSVDSPSNSNVAAISSNNSVENLIPPSVADQLNQNVDSTSGDLLKNKPKVKSTIGFTGDVNKDINDPNVLKAFNLSKDSDAPDKIKLETLDPLDNIEEERENIVIRSNEIERSNDLQNTAITPNILSNSPQLIFEVIQSDSRNEYDLLKSINIQVVDEFDRKDNEVSKKNSTGDGSNSVINDKQMQSYLKVRTDLMKEPTKEITSQHTITPALFQNAAFHQNYSSTLDPASYQPLDELAKISPPGLVPPQKPSCVVPNNVIYNNGSNNLQISQSANVSSLQNTQSGRILPKIVSDVQVVKHTDKYVYVQYSPIPPVSHTQTNNMNHFIKQRNNHEQNTSPTNKLISYNVSQTSNSYDSYSNPQAVVHKASEMYHNFFDCEKNETSLNNNNGTSQINMYDLQVSSDKLSSNNKFCSAWIKALIEVIKENICILQNLEDIQLLINNLINHKTLSKETWSLQLSIINIIESFIGIHYLYGSKDKACTEERILQDLPYNFKSIQHLTGNNVIDSVLVLYVELKTKKLMKAISSLTVQRKINTIITGKYIREDIEKEINCQIESYKKIYNHHLQERNCQQ